MSVLYSSSTRRAVSVLLIAVVIPNCAFAAQNPNAQLVNRCVAGTIQKNTFFSKASIKEWMPRQVTSRASTCNDELVYIDVGLGAGVTICSIRKCASGDQAYGCKQGQTQPFVLFATSDGKPPAKISKCHGAQAIANALAQTVESESPDALVALTTPPNPSAVVLAQPPIVPVPPAQSAATQQLRDVFDGRIPDKVQAAQVLVDAGVPAPVAQQAAQMIASGDKAGADQLLATAGLNPQVIHNQTGLVPNSRNVVPVGIPNANILTPQNTSFVSSDWSGRQSLSSASNPFEGMFKQLLSLFGFGGNSATSPIRAPSGSPAPVAAQQQVSSLAQRALENIEGKTVSQDLNPILRPVATLFAQPALVKRGSPIVVSWSSVGMKANGCTLRSSEMFLAQKHEGTKIIAAQSLGVITFQLTCTPLSGLVTEKITSVTVTAP